MSMKIQGVLSIRQFLYSLLISDFREKLFESLPANRMDEEWVDLKARDDGKFSLVKFRMRYRQGRCFQYEVSEQQYIQVYDPGTVLDAPYPPHFVFYAVKKPKQLKR